MRSTRIFFQEFFCATWSSKPVLSRGEVLRALNHRSHRTWMIDWLERKSELARLNVIAAVSVGLLWLKHHMNFRVRQATSRAWMSPPSRAIEHARAALQHNDPSVREDGLAILAYFGDSSSLNLIKSLFDHSHPQTRHRAQLAARAIEREMPILFVAPQFSR